MKTQDSESKQDFMAVEQKVDDYVAETREDFIDRMREEGFDIVFPAADTLQIDIDSATDAAIFNDRWSMFVVEMSSRGASTFMVRAPSRSGLPGKEHITIQVLGLEFSASERIAWQAALGSDWKREMLSMFRLLDGDETPTLFAEKKDA